MLVETIPLSLYESALQAVFYEGCGDVVNYPANLFRPDHPEDVPRISGMMRDVDFIGKIVKTVNPNRRFLRRQLVD